MWSGGCAIFLSYRLTRLEEASEQLLTLILRVARPRTLTLTITKGVCYRPTYLKEAREEQICENGHWENAHRYRKEYMTCKVT